MTKRNLTKEIWKEIPGFPEYEVSSHGKIISHKGPVPHLIEPYDTGKGYYQVQLYRDLKVHKKSIHRLVLESFIGPPPSNKYQACHNDGDKSNNHYKNLRWGTNSDNQMDRVNHQTSNRGGRNPTAKINEKDIPVIFSLRNQGLTYREIGEKYNVHSSAIWKIYHKKTWNHL